MQATLGTALLGIRLDNSSVKANLPETNYVDLKGVAVMSRSLPRTFLYALCVESIYIRFSNLLYIHAIIIIRGTLLLSNNGTAALSCL
jgi:hypothetical protein